MVRNWRTIRDLEKPKAGKTGRGTRGANLRLVESLLVLLEPRLRRAQLVLEPCDLPLQLRLAARRRARLAAAQAPRLHAARAVVQHLQAASARAAVSCPRGSCVPRRQVREDGVRAPTLEIRKRLDTWISI